MELSYIAGLFDGEGCVAIRRFFRNKVDMYQLWVQVTNVDPRLILPLKEKFGGSVHVTKHKNLNQRDTLVWISTGAIALTFLKAVRPWMVAKAEQADIAISFQEDGTAYSRVTGEQRARRRKQYTEITALKFRTFNPTDFDMGANSGDTQNGQSRAKQGESLGVCNDQVPPSTEKI